VAHEGVDASSLAGALGGTWVGSGATRCFVVERRVARDGRHGRVQIGALADSLRESADQAALFTGDTAPPPFCFFDLETTGLSGGAGTYAFLVGAGWFDDEGGFVVRQHLLPRAVDERPMLQTVAEQLATAGTLVSFNGKSFDAPLLETRFAYHRLPWEAGRLPHFDVLHPARRFWRSDAVSGDASPCSLSTLERQVLGARRLNDLPGFEAPGRYFAFIRTGDARPLADVLDHNRNDLISLAGLTVRLLQLVRAGAQEARDAREALALGRVYERAGRPDPAREALECALALPAPGATASTRTLLRVEALRTLAILARRARRYDEAASRWCAVLDTPGCPQGFAREAAEALAIHHEHRVRDVAAAHAFALRTLDAGVVASRHAAVRHRLARLERKLHAGRDHCDPRFVEHPRFPLVD